MKKRTIVLIVIGAVMLTLQTAGALGGVCWLFSQQYNIKGVSHFLVLSWDLDQPKVYIGDLGEYKVYVERLNLEDLNFRSVNAENVPMEEAVRKGLVSVDEWKKYAFRTVQDGETEILRFENYESAITDGECVFRPYSIYVTVP